MTSPTLRQLRTFLAAVETGSVTAAARALGLTQPAASQQLRELERGFGVRLLDRAGGRVVPTAAGGALVEPARRAREAAEDAEAAMAAHRAGETGRVRLGTGATACIHLLPPVLAAVKRRMPGIEIIVATGNSDDMVRRVEAGTLDLALVTMPAPISRGLAVTPLLADPLAALVPDAMTGGAAAATPALLGGLPLILYEPGGTTRDLVDAWFRQAGIAVRPIMELGSVEAIKMLVGSGLGATVLPGMALSRPVPGAMALPLDPAAGRDLAHVLRRDKVLDRALRLFIEELARLTA